MQIESLTLKPPKIRLVKSPRLHFVDTGLACYPLGIRSIGAWGAGAGRVRGGLAVKPIVASLRKPVSQETVQRTTAKLAPDELDGLRVVRVAVVAGEAGAQGRKL